MNDTERAELRALAQLLEEKWPTADATTVGYSGDRVAVLDAQVKDFSVYVDVVTL